MSPRYALRVGANLSVLFAGVVILSQQAYAGANLVSDQGFENGGAARTFYRELWRLDNHDRTHSGLWTSYVNALPAHPGSFSCAISQNIAMAPGDNYSIILLASRNDFNSTGSEVVISFGGTTLFDEVTPAFNMFRAVDTPSRQVIIQS